MIALPPGLQDGPEACRLLFEHWTDIRGDALVPPRSGLDPGRLRPALPFMQIVEVVSPALIRCKLSGTALRDMLGFDVTGRNILEVTPPAQRRDRSWRYWTGVHHPCGSLFSGLVRFGTGALSPYLGLGLPLRPSQDGGPMLVVSAIAPVTDRGWINNRPEQEVNLADDFVFLDIGAGIPEAKGPPPDWTVTE